MKTHICHVQPDCLQPFISATTLKQNPTSNVMHAHTDDNHEGAHRLSAACAIEVWTNPPTN